MNKSQFQKLGLFFKEKREAAGLTQLALSHKLKYGSKQIVSNWERGLCAPPLNKLARLVQILDLNDREVIKIFLEETEKHLKQKLRKK